jgi:ferric-dicitrate binding protein FerR (iron transport regulator)/Cu/Ag efflux protein CusF
MDANLHHLIQRYLDRLATADEIEELGRLLCSDPTAAVRFAEATRLHAGLAAHFEGKHQQNRMLALFPRQTESRGRPAARWRPMLAAAAAILVFAGAGLVYHFFFSKPDAPTPVAEQGPVAVLSGRVLVNGAAAPTIAHGALLSVEDGPAAVQLTDGSRILFDPSSKAILHGPVAGARQLVEMVAGSATFDVAAGEREFVVEGLMWRVTALGTEFQVELLPAEPSGESAMHLKAGFLAVAVFTGMVQVDFLGEPNVLAAGEGKTFAADKEQPKVKGAEFRGSITAIDSKSVTLGAGENAAKTKSFDLAADVKVVIDGQPGKLADLKVGMVVFATLDEGKTTVKGLRAEGGSAGGEVKAIDAKARTITIAGKAKKEGNPPEPQTFGVTPDAKIVIDGKPATLADVKTGAVAALRLSLDGKSAVSVLQGVKGKEGGEKGKAKVINGEIKAVDASNNSVTIVLGKEAGEKTFKLGADAIVMIDGKPGKLADVKTGSRGTLKLSDDEKTVMGLSVGQKMKTEKNK